MRSKEHASLIDKFGATALTVSLLPAILGTTDRSQHESSPTLAHSQRHSKENVLSSKRNIIFEKGEQANMALLREAQKEIEATKGYREKSDGYTKYGDWYQKNIVTGPKNVDWHQKDLNSREHFEKGDWCDMFIAYTAKKAGVEKSAGQFALTTEHAEWFKKRGAWDKKPKPGYLVFFSWKGSKKIDDINHVGIVEKVEKNGDIHTIEGNFHDRLGRMVRSQEKVVGYGDPSKG